MPLPPLASAVLFVANVERLARFYHDVAAMTTAHAANDHVVLGIDGFQLVIHALPGAERASGPAATSVSVREDSYIKICFPVVSIASARLTAAALGGFIKPAGAEWSARGFRGCDGHDPEGNVLHVRETDGATPP